jgi:hypothetical protein
MNRELLERPFDAALVKTRRGAFGQTICYVEGAEYIRRLNAAFDGRWNFEIVNHHILNKYVVVVGRLTAGDIVKMAFGGSAITVARESGEQVNIADDLKAAATDSLKKAASMLGVGLHLYTDNGDSAPKSNEHSNEEKKHSDNHKTENGHSTTRPSGANENSPPRTSNGGGSQPLLTTAQYNAIRAIAKSREVSPEDLERRSVEAFGVVPEKLSKKDASSFIKELQQLPHRGAS